MWACERFEWWKQVSPQPPAQKELGQVMEERREGGSHRCWNTLGGAPLGMIWGMMREYIFETHLLHPELGGRLIDEKGVKTDVMCQNRARQSSLGVPSSATLLSGSETKPETRNVTPILVFLRKTRWKKGVVGNLTEKDKCGVWLWGETWTRASLSWSLQASSSPSKGEFVANWSNGNGNGNGNGNIANAGGQKDNLLLKCKGKFWFWIFGILRNSERYLILEYILKGGPKSSFQGKLLSENLRRPSAKYIWCPCLDAV